MRELLVVVGAVLGLWAGPALAQEAEPSQRSRELAQRYVELFNFRQQVRRQLVGSMELADDWAAAVTPQGPGAPKPDTSADMPLVLPENTLEPLDPMIALMEEVLVEAHARVFSEAELAALVAFYETPEGQGIAARQAELNLMMTTLTMERLPEMLGSMGLDEDLTMTGDGEGVETYDWVDPTPPLIRQMAPGL